jgi:hypothetical protein
MQIILFYFYETGYLHLVKIDMGYKSGSNPRKF